MCSRRFPDIASRTADSSSLDGPGNLTGSCREAAGKSDCEYSQESRYKIKIMNSQKGRAQNHQMSNVNAAPKKFGRNLANAAA